MARNNRLWGAERIRGELLKFGIHLAKRTIPKYLRRVGDHRPREPSWSTFQRNHAHVIRACDSLQTCDLLFRPLFALTDYKLG